MGSCVGRMMSRRGTGDVGGGESGGSLGEDEKIGS